MPALGHNLHETGDRYPKADRYMCIDASSLSGRVTVNIGFDSRPDAPE